MWKKLTLLLCLSLACAPALAGTRMMMTGAGVVASGGGPTFALVQKNGGGTNGSASIVPTLGSATTSGNSIFIFAQGAGTITTPSGFTSRSPQVNVQGLYLFEKLVASGNSTDTPTLTMSGAFNATWQIAEYSGVTSFDTSSGNNAAGSACVAGLAITTPTITPGTGLRVLLAFAGASGGNPQTFTAGDPQSWTNSFTG